MINFLQKTAHSIWFWSLLILACLIMEGIALFYQYVLDYGPCVLCIHVRIWVFALLIAAVFALLVRQKRGINSLALIASTLASIGLLERSYQTLAVEKGWKVGECNMDSGLPDWFALDRWIPSIFEPWEPCGYTPELLLGITMAEGLIVFSAGLSLVLLLFTLLSFQQK